MAGRVTSTFTIRMEPDGRALALGFEDWAEGVERWDDVFPHVVRLIRNHHRRTFDSEGAATGPRQRWAPLSPAYAARKAREYPGRKILERTGALRRSLVDGGPGSRERVTRRSVEVGPAGRNLRIAQYHQDGTSRMKARTPVQYVKDMRGNKSLVWVINQMLQAKIVMHRRRALAGEKVTSADRTKLRGTLARLEDRRTR